MTYEEKKELALSYLKNKERYNEKRPYFNRLYPFTTENLSCFLNEKLLKNKKVLITGSSTDQIITSQLYDAKKITHFDINPFVEFMYELKKAAIKELSMDDYLMYFYDNFENIATFDSKVYQQVRNSLSGNSLDFWDTLYSNYAPISIRRKLFIINNEEPKQRYYQILPYMTKDNFEYLQQKEFIPIEYIKSDILKLGTKLTDKYDMIYFSNIFGRIEMIDFYNYNYIRNLYNFMNDILEHTEIDGKILLNYFYGYNKRDFISEANKKNNKYIRYPARMFKCEDNLSYIEVPSMAEYGTDTVLVYTKKKH